MKWEEEEVEALKHEVYESKRPRKAPVKWKEEEVEALKKGVENTEKGGGRKYFATMLKYFKREMKCP